MNENESNSGTPAPRDVPGAMVAWRAGRMFRAGDVAGALSTLEAHVARAENLEARAARCLGVGGVCENAGQYAAACAFFSRGLALEPCNVGLCYYLHNNLAYNLNQLGRHAEAERHSRWAIDQDPLRHNAWKNLGIALEAQEHWSEAAKAYCTAARACPPDGRALRLLEALALRQREDVAARLGDVDAVLDVLHAMAERATAEP